MVDMTDYYLNNDVGRLLFGGRRPKN